MVIARTTEGDVGILPNHAPMLSLHGARRRRRDDHRRRDLDRGGRRRVPLGGATTGSRCSPSTPRWSHDIDLEKARRSSSVRGRGDDDESATEPPRGAVARSEAPDRTPGAEARRPAVPTGPASGALRACSTHVNASLAERGMMPVWQWLVDSAGVVLLSCCCSYGLVWWSAVGACPATAAPSSSASASGPAGPGAAGCWGWAATARTRWSGSGSSRPLPGRGRLVAPQRPGAYVSASGGRRRRRGSTRPLRRPQSSCSARPRAASSSSR